MKFRDHLESNGEPMNESHGEDIIVQKHRRRESITPEEFQTYLNLMDFVFDEVNDRFSKFVDLAWHSGAYNKKEMMVLQEARKLLNFEGKPNIAQIKDLVKEKSQVKMPKR